MKTHSTHPCARCRLERPVERFERLRSGRHRNTCMDCVNASKRTSHLNCNKCKLTQPRESFYDCTATLHGKSSWCKSCTYIRAKQLKASRHTPAGTNPKLRTEAQSRALWAAAIKQIAAYTDSKRPAR